MADADPHRLRHLPHLGDRSQRTADRILDSSTKSARKRRAAPYPNAHPPRVRARLDRKGASR
jgi:hypothetical protein